jgi:hypothetical protein
MVGTLVRELSDGEELVLEGVPVRGILEDPRERGIEVRRLAVRRLSLDRARDHDQDQSANQLEPK